MKTIDDVKARLIAEVDQWFRHQMSNPHSTCHLWYKESTKEHDGGFLILQDAPPNPSYRAAAAVSRALTKDQAYHQLLPVVMRLPILSVREEL